MNEGGTAKSRAKVLVGQADLFLLSSLSPLSLSLSPSLSLPSLILLSQFSVYNLEVQYSKEQPLYEQYYNRAKALLEQLQRPSTQISAHMQR
ncbi:hypothetical protein M422DRAFT_23281 [Sphaerobolus stellatus SS14]|nr:hypothetical protein M422DRAFT_23281 [Sphaerobolus stellatus SS14]